jgi:hypothetical protein
MKDRIKNMMPNGITGLERVNLSHPRGENIHWIG